MKLTPDARHALLVKLHEEFTLPAHEKGEVVPAHVEEVQRALQPQETPDGHDLDPADPVDKRIADYAARWHLIHLLD